MPKVLLRKTATLRREIRSKGFLRVTKITTARLAVFVLSKIYKFPASWHPPTSARPYRLMVAKVVNDLKPHTVCEVGCGLGSILCRVDANERFGFDIDPGVVRAAKLLRGRKIHFAQGGLTAVHLSHIDVLILVNWIHEISPSELERELMPLLSRTRYLLLDAIDQDNSFGYRYKHDFSFLEGKAKRLSVTRHPNEGRSFQLFEVVV